MITSLESYLSEIKKVYSKFHSSKHLFFRGHSKQSYVLKPSVFRAPPYKEKDLLLDFKHYAPYHDINYDFVGERDKVLADMQHHEIPTRLLDWTIAPLNALFFACSENDAEDGQIIIFNPWEYWSKTVRDKKETEIHQILILSRALLSGDWEFQKIGKYISKKFNYIDLKPEDIEKPFPYISSYTNNRILHQRGCFTIHGTNKVEIDCLPEAIPCIKRLDIKSSDKKKLLEELNYLYINQYSIYPDFEGMQKMIKDKGSLFNLKTR